jgi:hypothetical protein
VGGWSCLKMITVGFDSYSVELKQSCLVKCKLEYVVHIIISGQIYKTRNIHSVQQKSSGMIFRTSRSGSDMTYDCHHN